MENIDTEVPVYELHVGGRCIAMLYAPQWEDMFWYSYEVRPIDQEASLILRDREVWKNVSFIVKDLRGWLPNPETFSGGYDEFCDGKTDRLTFRSLWPPQPERKAGFLKWITRKLQFK